MNPSRIACFRNQRTAQTISLELTDAITPKSCPESASECASDPAMPLVAARSPLAQDQGSAPSAGDRVSAAMWSGRWGSSPAPATPDASEDEIDGNRQVFEASVERDSIVKRRACYSACKKNILVGVFRPRQCNNKMSRMTICDTDAPPSTQTVRDGTSRSLSMILRRIS